MVRIIAIQLILVFSLSLNSYGDVMFEMEHSNNGSGEVNRSTVVVKGNKMKMDHYEDSGTPENTMIYRGDRELMIIVDHDDDSYIIMDKKTMKQLSDKLNSAMAQMEQAMKNVPPEHREMMKKMMKDKMPGAGNSDYIDPVLKKTGAGNVNGYSCTKYDVYKGDEKVRQHCITDWGNITGGSEISSVMLEMSEFMDDMTKTFSQNSGPLGSTVQFERNVFNQLKEMNGFPVSTVEFDNGKIEAESVFKSSKITKVDPSVFEAPTGYKRQNIELN